MELKKNKLITEFEIDTTKWYTDIITKAELIDYGPVKGTIFLKPYGFKIWKNIQTILTNEFETFGVEEISMPLLFPYSFLEKEKNHINGFAPEVFVVTKIGDKTIQPLVIRPTSEILFAEYFHQNLFSYKQLPIKLNQWVNVMRGEKNTRPFLRTSEFLWQEGHTIHYKEEEAKLFTLEILNLYKAFFNNNLDMFVLSGEKTEHEKFAGAEKTYTIETILKDGKSLQSGTSHFLGQTFTKAFNIEVQDSNQQKMFPFQTSWGVSTRLIGAIIMAHSDNNGLVLPWDVSPFHFVILTIKSNDSKISEEINNYTNSIYNILKNLGYRVFIDTSDKSISFKTSEWELKGVPIRIEIGPKDLNTNSFILIKRSDNLKTTLSFEKLTKSFIENLKVTYKNELFQKTEKTTIAKIVDVFSFDELKKVLESDLVARAYWLDDSKQEELLKEKFIGATIRLINKVENSGFCLHSKQKINTMVLISKAY